jgi:peptidoglycan/xylan/chitin deacetylase (PgdA/CDA1 family)
MYHSVDDDSSGACVRPKRFDEQMAYLRRSGYNCIDLDTLYHHMTQRASLPARPLVITFDDGYRDNVEKALPILKKYDMRATIFLTTDHIGFDNRWVATEGIPLRPLLAWDEVRSAAAECILSFQAHTCSHPRLTQIPREQVRQEMTRSKHIIEERLGKPCRHIAYPYGDFNDEVRDVAQESGFRTACSTRWGHNRQGGDLFSLYRIGVRNGDSLSDFKRILGGPPPLWKYYWLRLKRRYLGRHEGHTAVRREVQ